MKIAIVLPPGYRFCAEDPNSIETVVRTLSSGSRDDIRVFCDTGARVRDAIPVTEIDPGDNRLLRRARMIAAIKAFGPDYIEFHQHAISASAIARALKPVPNSLYRHNYVKPPKHIFDRWRIAWRNRPFDRFIFVSEAAKADFLASYPHYADIAHAVPNPIDTDQWPGDAHDKDKTIIFAGRAAPEKGLAPLCEGLADLLPRHPDWRAVLVLNRFEVHKDWTQALLDRLLRLTNQVTVLKDQPFDAVKAQMRRAAIAVVPSVWQEPFGLAALEGHAAGCAVVSSGTGGLREASADHAVYVAQVSASSLADALETLMTDPERRIALAVSGQDFVRSVQTIAARQAQLDIIRRDIVIGRAT